MFTRCSCLRHQTSHRSDLESQIKDIDSALLDHAFECQIILWGWRWSHQSLHAILPVVKYTNAILQYVHSPLIIIKNNTNLGRDLHGTDSRRQFTGRGKRPMPSMISKLWISKCWPNFSGTLLSRWCAWFQFSYISYKTKKHIKHKRVQVLL